MAERNTGRAPGKAGVLACLWCLCWGAALAAPADLEGLARDLMDLRSRVEALQTRLDGLEEQRKSRLAALAQQRAETEANLRRARIQVRQLEETLAAHRREIHRNQAQDRTLVPALKQAMEAECRRIRAGLPFKVQARLGVLADIEDNLEQGAITAAQAASRLWAFLEDEARLARESGLHREPVTVAGEEVLADVARLGLVALYYRTPGGPSAAPWRRASSASKRRARPNGRRQRQIWHAWRVSG